MSYLHRLTMALIAVGLITGLQYCFANQGTAKIRYPKTPAGSAFHLDFEDGAYPNALFEDDVNPTLWSTRVVKGRITFGGGTARLANSMSDWDGETLTSGGVRSKAFYGYGDLEFRLRASEMPGVITSIYMYNEDRDLGSGGRHDEIDVEIAGSSPNLASLMAFHNASAAIWEDEGNNFVAGGLTDISDVSGLGEFDSREFHRWKIRYRPKSVTWYVDGTRALLLKRAVPSAKMQILFHTYYNADWTDFSGSPSGSGTAELDWISFVPFRQSPARSKK